MTRKRLACKHLGVGWDSQHKGPEAETGLASWRDLTRPSSRVMKAEGGCDSWRMRSETGRARSVTCTTGEILSFSPPAVKPWTNDLISQSLGFLAPNHGMVTLHAVKVQCLKQSRQTLLSKCLMNECAKKINPQTLSQI